MPQLTLDELQALADGLADPNNQCDACRRQMPGILAPCCPGNDQRHCFIEACNACDRYKQDEDAAKAIAEKLGLNVRKRYDRPNDPYYRPFVCRPGDDDDHNFIGINADDAGCNPTHEIRIPE